MAGRFREGPSRVAPEVSARLSSGGYVFPVYGTASFGDSFGAPRADVPGGWHHGEDIFAAAGTPLLAVADGTLHTIGFNRIGGYRLWLRDTQGNEFYYAHLSAYSPLAVEGRTREGGRRHRLRRRHGRRGRRSAAPPLRDPPGVDGWDSGTTASSRRTRSCSRGGAREDISFSAGPDLRADRDRAATTLPPPGAVLLEADDIASTSGLVPGALEKALKG